MFTRLATKFRPGWCVLLLAFVSSLVAQTTLPPILQGLNGGGALDYGQRLSLTAILSGSTSSTYSYQWRKNGTDIPGATSANYTIASVTYTDAGSYAVTVSNSAGSSAASTTVTVKAPAAPAWTTQPRDLVMQVGQQAIFFSKASGAYPLVYQWYKDGVAITGGTASTFVIDRTALADAGSYYVVVTNDLGTATSTTVSLIVNAATPITLSTNSPSDATFTEGASGSLWASLNTGSSPITYQWRKDGIDLPGATSAQLAFAVVKLTDGGRYSVVVTNPAGSVTSREAVVTVKPATPVVFSAQPQSLTVYEGQQANWSLYVSAGSSPITFQWRKNGVAIAGATNGYYNIPAATLADAGDYTLVATNAAGSVATNAAHLSVSPAVPPTLSNVSQSATVLYQGGFSITANVSGTPPFTFEYSKNGQSFSNYNNNSYWVSSAKPSDSGTYTMTVKNAAGSVTTAPIIITVLPAAKVVMTEQPKDLQVAEGQRASLTIRYSTAGAGNYGVQWYKNGEPIPGALGSYTNYSTGYGLEAAKPADAGVYYAIITSEGGAVTTSSARISVLPPEAPSMEVAWNWPQTDYKALGEYKTWGVFTTSYMHGSPPFTYQWYKDGQLITDATNAGYTISNIKESDYGFYTLTISNAGGVISSPPFELRPTSTKAAWVAAERFGDVVYFLATAPNRIERYDLAAERWLPSTPLDSSRIPTALLPTADGVYLAYGRALVRRSLDLTVETPLLNSVSDIIALCASGNYVYYTAYLTSPQNTTYTTKSFERTTIQPGSGLTAPVHHFAVAARKGFVFAAFDGGINQRLLIAGADGQLSETTTSVTSTAYPTGPRLYVSPNEEFGANRGGSIFRLDTLAYVGSYGPDVADLDYLTDSTAIVVRGRTIQAMHATTFRELGAATLPFRATRVFARGSRVFAFGGPDSNNAFKVAALATTAIAKPVLTPPTIATSDRYSIDGVFLGADGVVNVFSRSRQAIVRWSTNTRSFLSPVALRGTPLIANQTDGSSRALFAYNDGQITAVPLRAAATVEESFTTVGNGVMGMTDLSGGLLVNARVGFYDSSNTRMTFDDQGRPLFANAPAEWRNVLGWNASLRRIYSGPISRYDDHTLRAEVVGTDGSLGTGADTAVALMSNVNAPVRFNADGSLMVTGNGRVLNGDLLETGVLSNDILDAAWLPDNLYTLRAKPAQTEVQRWSRKNHLQNGATMLPGTPLRVFRLSDTQLVVVTNVLGRPFFTILAADLSIATSPVATEVIATQPVSQAVDANSVASLSVATTDVTDPLTYQWRKDGVWLAGESASTLNLGTVDSAASGLYTAVVATQTVNETSDVAIVGVNTTDKVLGTGHEVGSDIVHPNGNVYDQVLLEGKALSVTANPGQVVRTSFIDMSDDIVQVEFTGAGTLSLVLDQATDAAPPVNYNQPNVSYVKGHARIVITGADETTNVSVFTVGKANAVNQSLFRDDVKYDGIADIASIAILSRNGKFGGLRAANVNFFASNGLTGVFAPNVAFSGPVYVGDINAYDAGQATLILGSAEDVRITGGSLLQANDRCVNVDGFSELQFTDGSTSHGDLYPAQSNQGRLMRDGTDVTSELIARP